MSIFGSILSRVFGRGPVTAPTPDPERGILSAPPEPEIAAGKNSPMTPADVDTVLTNLAATNGQGLNWQTSIVDLMKLVGIDSSLQARKDLAQELHYTGDTNDSASMNIWLHKQVMAKLAENGGEVPASLKD